jgi:broad specificity phosphatase PhoE
LGRDQAERLRERLARSMVSPPQLVLTSVLPRAVETAAILAPVIGNAVQECGLCELHPGECDGQPLVDHESRYPSQEAPDEPFSKSGESLRTFDERVRTELRLLTERVDRYLVVVTHCGFIEAATRALLGLPGLAERGDVELDWPRHTSLTEWEVQGTVRRLHRYNDYSHLVGIPHATGAPPLAP